MRALRYKTYEDMVGLVAYKTSPHFYGFGIYSRKSRLAFGVDSLLERGTETVLGVGVINRVKAVLRETLCNE